MGLVPWRLILVLYHYCQVTATHLKIGHEKSTGTQFLNEQVQIEMKGKNIKVVSRYFIKWKFFFI